jgi:hypothetical protein
MIFRRHYASSAQHRLLLSVDGEVRLPIGGSQRSRRVWEPGVVSSCAPTTSGSLLEVAAEIDYYKPTSRQERRLRQNRTQTTAKPISCYPIYRPRAESPFWRSSRFMTGVSCTSALSSRKRGSTSAGIVSAPSYLPRHSFPLTPSPEAYRDAES